ncbi:helix-turn-helix domain-containing protein [Brevibacillus laterosporus]|uniref:Helix-turn-helix transcriptional regulator n=1 Tax=Brevibacillus laterosporus TaxID=1465 RepID=A0AAP3DHE0_BRELA|nr:helix-turn-helix transcriptional regulator [Brevibacillus laterosporus]MCR8980938.1 helix-turn-helix domain-containing protein [Brevibacillus laterosporus]MCZ0808093.1 helix-turn-helix transcriptional regulator [Brevibacillus laterosporus]MCZ0826285.1 helix-turn-helix transcriptional regulator [Brevibacillus laterosporus]MCZ0850168.1 helix-turn-helix transcriptional regulator [Brevibacillus laterosporus]
MRPERLRMARDHKNLKQTQVMTYTGINNKTLSGYEKGVSEPDTETLKTLANLYEVSVDWLVGNTDDPTPRKETKDFTPDAEEIKKILASLPSDKRKYFLEQISILAAGIRAMEKKE